MGKIITEKVRTFDTGISSDLRSGTGAASVKHFDIFSNPHRLSPQVKTIADEYDSASTGIKSGGIKNFIAVDSVLYGYGQRVGFEQPKVYYKSGNFYQEVNTWNFTSNSEATTGGNIYGMFFHYKGYIYGVHGTTSLWRYTVGGGTAFVDAQASLSQTVVTVANGVIHPITDNAYFAYNNVVAKVSTTTVTDNVLSIPTKYQITSLTPFGDFLAIAAQPKNGDSSRSVVFLWDQSSVYPVVVDWGEGQIKVLENIQGVLIGVSSVWGNNSFSNNRASIAIKGYSGGTVQTLKELRLSGASTLAQTKLAKDNILYFSGDLQTERGLHQGIFAFGRKDSNSPFALSMAINEEEVTSISATINGFIAVGNFWWIAHNIDGSVNKTYNYVDVGTAASAFTYTSTYDTNIIDAKDPSIKKKLIGVTVSFAPLPPAGQVVLKYRKDEETSYTTIFTHTTDNSVYHSSINIESTGANLPQFSEIQFRIESTGGAEITGYECTYEAIDTNLYSK